MYRTNRDVNNNIKNKRQFVESSDDDDGIAHKRYKHHHAEQISDALDQGGAASEIGAEAKCIVAIAHTITNTQHTPLVHDHDATAQTAENEFTVNIDEPQLVSYGKKDWIDKCDANIDQTGEKSEEPAAGPEPQSTELSGVNTDCVMEVLKRFRINDLASIAHTSKFFKECAENVFMLTHRGHLTLNYVEGEQEALLRTIETFGPLATSMTITETGTKTDNEANIAIQVAAEYKGKWNMRTVELNNLKIDFSELASDAKLKMLAVFSSVDKLIVKDCQLTNCELLFEFIKDQLIEISIDDSDLDFSMLKEYPNLKVLKLKFMGDYCDHHKEFHRNFIQSLLTDNDMIEHLELMCTNLNGNQLALVAQLDFLESLTLNVRKQMDLLPLAHLLNLKTLTLFGNRRVNVAPLMQALDNHPTITAIHLNKIKNGTRFLVKSTTAYER